VVESAKLLGAAANQKVAIEAAASIIRTGIRIALTKLLSFCMEENLSTPLLRKIGLKYKGNLRDSPERSKIDIAVFTQTDGAFSSRPAI
jgi:hypothetical protein